MGFIETTIPEATAEHQEADFGLFDQPPPTQIVTLMHHWDCLLSTMTLPDLSYIIVQSATHSRCLVKSYQHEFIRLDLLNTVTQ